MTVTAASPLGSIVYLEDVTVDFDGFKAVRELNFYMDHRELRVVNLGAQVDAEHLVDRASEEQADAILVSQVVTQRDAHLHHVREVAEALAARWPKGRPRPLLLVGGPRFDPAMAEPLGADRIFTKGTTPGEVASYLVHALAQSAGARKAG